MGVQGISRAVKITRAVGALLAVGFTLLALPALASAQHTNFQAPAEDQYGQPSGSTPPPSDRGGPGGREQSRDPRGRGDDGAVGGRRGGRDRESGAGGITDDRGLPLRDAEGGSLPFTGLDLSLLVAIGLALIAAGLGLRAARRQPT